jgi:hypothetical protein
LFSTTFFNFQVGANGNIVSAWLWLYFVITTILSAIIFTWWYVTSRSEVHKVYDTFGGGRHQKGTGLWFNQENEDDEKRVK